jgi:hypothetical protein
VHTGVVEDQKALGLNLGSPYFLPLVEGRRLLLTKVEKKTKNNVFKNRRFVSRGGILKHILSAHETLLVSPFDAIYDQECCTFPLVKAVALRSQNYIMLHEL